MKTAGLAGESGSTVVLAWLDSAGNTYKTVVDQKYLPVAVFADTLVDVQDLARRTGVAVFSAQIEYWVSWTVETYILVRSDKRFGYGARSQVGLQSASFEIGGVSHLSGSSIVPIINTQVVLVNQYCWFFNGRLVFGNIVAKNSIESLNNQLGIFLCSSIHFLSRNYQSW